MNKQFFSYLVVIVIAITVAFTSCKTDEKVEPALTLEKNEVEFAANPAGAQTVTVQANINWSVAIQQTGNWLSVTPANGNNNGTLTISAQANTATAERSATITVSGTGVPSKTIAVTQEAATIPETGVMINGVVWATRNVGAAGKFADNPESAGMFYQWNRKKAWATTGAVTGWDSSMPTGETWEKANDPCPDGWRLPILEEIVKLIDNTKVDYEWTTVSGINGGRFTDKTTGNSIFVPIGGGRLSDGSIFNANIGYCWGSYLTSDTSSGGLTCSSTSCYTSSVTLNFAIPIRPVKE